MARVLIAGAGALGSVFGGFLRLAQHEVTLLGRTAHLNAIAEHGLRIDGLWGEHCATGFDLAGDAQSVRGEFDAILITVKSYDTAAMAGAIAAHRATNGVVISLQNGLGNVETLARHISSDHILAGRVIFGAAAIASRHVRVTVYAEPVLIGAGRAGNGDEPHLAALARVWARHFAAAGIPSEYCADIEAALWGKVLYNAALNPLGALLGVHYGALSENAHTRAIMDATFDEVFAVATAEGVRLAWPTPAAYRAAFYGRLVPSTFNHRSSMLQDLERGRRTEVDAMNGEVWRRGEARGIATPVNEVLTCLVHAREAIKGGGPR